MNGPWIGVDPGARFCGVILRLGLDCLGSRTVEREEDETEIGVGPIFWAEISRSITALAGASVKGGYGAPRVAIEGVRAPGGFRDGKKQFAKPVDILALGATFGAIYNEHPDAVIIAPESNGRGMLAAYPENLVTRAEARLGLRREARMGSKVSHCRSAFDVAGKAALLDRRAA